MTKEKALICEPHTAIEAEISKIFDNLNIKAESTVDAKSALELMGNYSYDIVILNYTTTQNKKDKIFKQIKSFLTPQSSLIITGEDNKEYYNKSIKGGANYYFVIHPFDEERFSLMIKQALERKQLISENIRLKKEVELLRNIRNIASTINPKEFFSSLLDSIINLTKCHYGFIAIQEGYKEDLVVQINKGSKRNKKKKNILGMDQQFLKNIIESRKPLFIENTRKANGLDPSFIEEEAVNSLFLWPIVGEMEASGIVVIGRRGNKKDISKKEIFYVNKLLKNSSTAIKNVLSFQKVFSLSLRDDITTAFNRRFFESFIEEEIQRSRRYNLDFSLIFIDLNNFKRVNELYGHSTGSRMLGEVAKRIIDKVRSVDRVVRYGGDEFCIMLPETDAKGAFKVAKRIKQKIEEEPFRFSNTEDTYITASFGISNYPQHGLTKKRLLSLADKAMFDAKKSGRNQISIANSIKKTD